MRWFQALMPRENSFTDQFIAHARVLVMGAQALRELLDGGEAVPKACAAIIQHEEEADAITRAVMQQVRRSFITPFDRSDIRDLTSSLDDAIDQMQKTAKAIILYGVSEFRPEMRELGDLAIQAAHLTLEATQLLRDMRRNAERLNAIAEAVTRIENRSDEIYDQGMRALLKACQNQPMAFIAGAEVFDHLEKVIDRFEDVANGISGILIENL